MNCHKQMVLGQIVRALAGRDKDKLFVVVGIADGTHVYIADGAKRKIEAPKIKNIKHLQKYNKLSEILNKKLVKGEMPENSVIREELSGYK